MIPCPALAALGSNALNTDRCFFSNPFACIAVFLQDKAHLQNEAGLKEAIEKIRELRKRFWEDLKVPADTEEINPELERAGRVADHLEFAELMCYDALDRDESCGGHFREEHQTEEGEAVRHDDTYANVSVWEFKGVGEAPQKHVEPLEFDNVHLSVRSYK